MSGGAAATRSSARERDVLQPGCVSARFGCEAKDAVCECHKLYWLCV